MSSKNRTLPSLAFGEAKAALHSDARSLGDLIQGVFPGLNAYDPLENPLAFAAKSCTIGFKKLTLVASSISPSIVDREGEQTPTVLFPLAGNCQVMVGSTRLEWGAGKGGVFLPEFDGRILGSGDTRSLLMFQLDREGLEQTARTMFDLDGDLPDLRLDEARLTPTALGGHHLEPVLRRLAGIIDLYHCDAGVLELLGLEEMLCRHVVGMLVPEKMLSQTTVQPFQRPVKRRVTDAVCDLMLADLGKRWALPDLQAVSGVSARTLQYGFQKRFGCSPMDWLKEQRLLRARSHLQSRDYITVTQLAHDCGFGNASQFAVYYKSRFGMSPSQT